MTVSAFPMGPLVPPLPEHETREDKDVTSGSSGGSSMQQLAPRAEQALSGMGAAIGGQQAVARQQGALNVQGAQEDAAAEQAAAAQQQQILQEKQGALTGAFSSTGEAYLAAKTRLQAANDRLNAMDAPALFANRDKAGQYRLGIAMALAGLGDAMRQSAMVRIGKDPGSHSTINDIIQTDLQRQREAIEKAKDSVVMAKTGLQDVDAARKALLEEIDMKGAILAKKAAEQMKATLAARKVPQAEIDANKTIADLTATKAKYELDVAGSLKTTMDKHWEQSTKTGFEAINRQPDPGKSGISPTQSGEASKAASLDNEIETIKKLGVVPAKGVLEKMQDNTAEAQAATGGGIGGKLAQVGQRVGLVARTPSEGVPREQQQLMNAWDNIFSIMVHDRTGAGMSENEAIREANNLKPVPGDSRATIEQKLQRAEWEAQKHALLAGKSAQDQLAILSRPMPSAANKPTAAPQAALAAEVPDSRRESIKAVLRKMSPGPKRDEQMQRFGIRPEELNGQ